MIEYENTKCGEIFRNIQGEISYLCLFCTVTIEKAVDFDEHIVMHFASMVPKPNEDTEDEIKFSIECMDDMIHFNGIKKLEIENVNDQELTNVATSQCEYCDQRFLCVGLKEAHGSVHGVIGKPYICDYCTATFDTRLKTQQHQRLHALSKAWTSECRHCIQIFQNKFELSKHLTYNSELDNVETIIEDTNIEQQVSVIYKQVSTDVQEQNHIKVFDAKAENVENSKYRMNNKQDDDFDDSLEANKTGRDEITKPFTENEPFDFDAYTSDSDTEQTKTEIKTFNTASKNVSSYFCCKVCDRKYVRKRNFKMHLKTQRHIERSQNPETIKFSKSESVMAGAQLLFCVICKKQLASRRQYMKHMKIHDPNVTIKYLYCDICGHVSKDRSNLICHMRIHSGEKPYSCPICFKKFTHSSYINGHIRMVHTGERPFLCTFCGHAFAVAGKLTAHIKAMHNDNRPTYKCTTCSKEYKSMEFFKVHLRVHTGERPFGCDLCECKFRAKDTLRHHKRIHSGEKPFSCKFCSMSFTQDAGRRGHEKRMHIDPYLFVN